MKLPDFFEFSPFNHLRESMGANEVSSFDLSVPRFSISDEEKHQLENTGIEIDSLDEVVELEDSTIVYKDTRVLLYIRDINQESKHSSLPKYHISWCKTLDAMSKDNRYSRYVISTRTDGLFEVRNTGWGRGLLSKSEKKLDVCKNCLDELYFNGYQSHLPAIEKTKIFMMFSLELFFQFYPRSPLDSYPKPRYNNVTSPNNIYSNDFAKISKDYRKSRKWHCEECKKDLSDKRMRQYLDVHHIDGRKHNNSEDNLRALCIICHSKQPKHKHMETQQRYQRYVSML